MDMVKSDGDGDGDGICIANVEPYMGPEIELCLREISIPVFT